MSETRKLRIGILQDSSYASVYIRDLITWAQQQDDLEVSHLIVYATPGETKVAGWRRKWNHLKLKGFRVAVLRGIRLLEQAVLRRYYGGKHRDHLRQFPVDEQVPNVVHIQPTISKSGLVYRFSAEEVAKVRSLDCDVLIRGGIGILRGDILTASRFGILSFHHGDNRVNRGGPAGFWESYYGWPATGFIIQRLTSELDGGDVLVRGSYATKWFFLFNQASLLSNSNPHLMALLKRLARERALPPAEEPLPYSGTLFRTPSVLVCIAYLARVADRLLRKLGHGLFRYRERWSVSFTRGDWRQAAFWRATQVKTPARRFLADPFVWEHEARTFCLVEDYVYREHRAGISAFEITSTGATDVVPVLAEPFHLSFPFLFEYDGGVYMCPECYQSRQIRLYRAVEFPYKWEFVKPVMTDVSASDSMLFERNGRWWLLTNLERTGRGDFRSELYLFSAESPLSDTWTPHPKNPIKIDPAGGRNAGLLRDGHRLFRAGQVQGFDRYGEGIRLFEIVSLSPQDYCERLVTEIRPEFRRGLLGTHHLASTGKVTVVDSHTREFIW
jgi:hypothetical protein